jgi:hypothetical protein
MAVVWVKPDGSSRELLHGCISFAACVFDLSEGRACMRLSSSWVVASSAGASRKPYEFILLGTLRIPELPVRKLLGEMAIMLVEGPCVLPGKLRLAHHPFRYRTLRAALRDLV